MPERHLKQLGFNYSACGPFTKNKERTHKFMQIETTNYIYRKDLNKPCFQRDMANGWYKDFTKRTESDKVLKDKAFRIACNPKYDGYERRLASMVYIFFDKNLKVVVLNPCQINNLQKNLINQLLENLKDAKSIVLLKHV